MMSQIESSGNGLQDSVILLDHRDAVDQNMQQEQIQPKDQNPFNIWYHMATTIYVLY